MSKDDFISADIVREFLDYDPMSGALTWKRREQKWFSTSRACARWNSIYAGVLAGSVHSSASGYTKIAIYIFNRPYLAHRLAWMHVYGEMPSGPIDHIDGNATNNRIENMMVSTYRKNAMNMSMNSRNSSGVTGVHWAKNICKWRASCRVKGRLVDLGSFHEEDLDLAAMAVLEFRKENGFSERHGLYRPWYAEERK